MGSAEFHDPFIAGQVDGTRARRSPGSTLKPFIYALALDDGLIQPQTLLDDAPKRFSGYNPENSDRQFLGPLAASIDSFCFRGLACPNPLGSGSVFGLAIF